MFTLDLQSRIPIYEQLKSKIGQLVLLGELKPDDQLPSVRSFARDLGINPNTVQKAYQELEREQIIYSVPGRGSYISPNYNVNLQLENQHISRIKHAVRQARCSGMEKHLVIKAVDDVYEKEELQ